MLDRTKYNDAENVIPFPGPDEVDQAVASLTAAASKVYELMLKPEHRERLCQEFEHICGSALALNLVVKQLEVRMVVDAELG